MDKPAEIYLDNNATTPVLPCAADAVMHCMQTSFGNPSSSHTTGIKAKVELEATRQLARQVIGASTGQIVFTSGATEGIQTSIVSALLDARAQGLTGPDVLLLYGATEHKAVPESLKHWNQVLQLGCTIQAVPVDQHGILDAAALEELVPQAALICTMAANNETGVKQNLLQLEQLIRRLNPKIRWMVDCVQALGKMSLNIANTSIDYAPFSGHKLYAPKGIGFLYVRQNTPYQPFIAGGGQESGLRSGTENLPGIAALHAIFVELLKTEQSVFQSEATLWQYREQLLSALVDLFPQLVLNSDAPYIVPTTINFAVPGFSSKDIMDLFDAAGIRVSSGSACSSKIPSSFVLNAMGLERWRSEGAIRLSFGPAMQPNDITRACEAIRKLIPVVQQCCLVLSDVQVQHDELVQGLTQFKHEDLCSYLLVCEQARSAVIIDPVDALANRLANIITGHGLTLVAVLDTHKHQDRRSARDDLAALLTVAERQVDALGWPVAASSLHCGQFHLQAIKTPGHSADSVSYVLYQQQRLLGAFVGDLILPGGTGRVDLADSNADDFAASLCQLHHMMAGQGYLLSSHDYGQRFTTTWDLVIQEQPVVRVMLAKQPSTAWLQELTQQSLQLQRHSQYLCGVVDVSLSDAKALIESHQVVTLLATDPNLLVVDVREPHEQGAGALEQLLPADANVVHWPLSRLVWALMTAQLMDTHRLLLVCRSGNRSLLAAKVLNRLGFIDVYNLKGGTALLS